MDVIKQDMEIIGEDAVDRLRWKQVCSCSLMKPKVWNKNSVKQKLEHLSCAYFFIYLLKLCYLYNLYNL